MTVGVVVLGAGGHAKVCIELLRASGMTVSFCIDRAGGPTTCLGVEVLHGDHYIALLRSRGFDSAFVALGENALRRRVGEDVRAAGFSLVNAISPQSVISPSARLGEGIAVMAGVIVNAEAEIGDYVILNTGATIDHDCRVGEAAHIAPQCALAGNVVVGQLSFLGIGVRVIPEQRIGERSTVGAGAVVISNIPDDVTAVGMPAVVIEPKNQENL